MSIQSEMQNLLHGLTEAGRERGVQLAVYYRGECVVDAWAGIADYRTGRPVDEATLFPVFSTTKGIAATVLHLLAERQQLDYEMKISDIWPEFGVNGKENCTVRHALHHASGIPQMPDGLGFEDIVDWNKMCAEVAKLAPLWPPGERTEYHAITFGWIVGEIARRADGRPFSQIVSEEICKPLGITDMYVGIPDDVEPRVAILEEPEFDISSIDTSGTPSIPSWIWPLHEWMNRPDARRACVPASNGIMTAKAIARHYAALLPGGVDGIELLPPSRVKTATIPFYMKDGTPTTVGMGYHLGSNDSVMGSLSSFGHGGYGGSIGFADPDNRLAIGFVNNLYSKNGAGFELIHEVKKRLGII